MDKENITDSVSAKNRIIRPMVSGLKAIDAVNVVAVMVRISRDNIML